MVQVLEGKPSFAQSIASALGGGLGAGISQGSNLAQQMMLEAHKQKQKRLGLGQELAGENRALKEKYGIDLEGITEPSARKAVISEGVKKSTSQTEQQGLSNALDWLEDNIEYTGSTSIPFTKSFSADLPLTMNREGLQKREEFTKTGFWATDQVYTHFNKGQISEAKLEVIKNDLSPKAELSERVNKSRIAALRRIANLPRNAPKEVVDKKINQELKAMKKIESSGENRPPIESFWE
jgi:hypothetical protein